MSRPARFTDTLIIDATARVAAQRGPAGTTVAEIARELRGPTGSIYHRFASRSVLLGEVWLRAVASFQDGFAERLAGEDPMAAGLAAVAYVPQWVRDNPDEARILLLYRSEDFLEKGWPPPMVERATLLRRRMRSGMARFSGRLLGRADANALRCVGFALAEAPLAAVRRYVEQGKPPASIVDALIEVTYRAAIQLAAVKR